jgi:iron complex transport system substrate-binding protein
MILGGGSAGGDAAFVQRWRAMPLAALRAIPARYIAPDNIQRQSPRIVDGVRAICASLERHREVRQGPHR